MGTVACKPDAKWPEVVARNSVCTLSGRNQPTVWLASLAAASFELPGEQSTWQGDAFWPDPSCHQCFNCSHCIPPVERLFSGVDYRKQRRGKTLVHA